MKRFAVSLAVVTLVGCSGETDAGPSSSPGKVLSNGVPLSDYVDACALLSDDELAAFLGPAPYEKRPETSGVGGVRIPEPTSCFISNAGRHAADVFVGYDIRGDAENLRVDFATVQQTAQAAGQAEPVEGLGDMAYRPLKDGIANVQVLVGRVTFTASYGSAAQDTATPEEEERSVELARRLILALEEVATP